VCRQRAVACGSAWVSSSIRSNSVQAHDGQAHLVNASCDAAWLGETELLDGMPRLAGIPGVLIHGRRDVSSPLAVPAALARAWPDAELVVIEDEGHGAGARTTEAIVAATDRFSRAARSRARA